MAALTGAALAMLPTQDAPAGWIVLAAASLCASAVAAWRFPREVPAGTLRARLARAGAVFFVVAAAADIAATLWHSPALTEEANVLVRPLVGRWPLAGILAGAGMVQLAFLSLSVSLWRNLLARWAWYIGEVQARGRLPFALALLGMRPGSLGRLLGMERHIDFVLATFAFYLPWAYVGRVYLAMEWMGWVPISRVAMPAALLAATWLTQYAVVRRACAARGDARPHADETNPIAKNRVG
ncbi:hypothetical protein [Stenotrophomonas sp. HITSZ_GD]|uniref:hypothetical protein n=1 Tax=Stenotrophomonas sp. HITSZ_GD TaxID=3037248 RepID=UPI00240E3935|nr:hypothetical protein [Stenotrophomonas sp. HITSZ_GD]